MRINLSLMIVMMLGAAACVPPSPYHLDEDNDDGTTGWIPNEPSQCTTDSDCPKNHTCMEQMWCEPIEIGPCDCSSGEVCIEAQCEPVQAMPACAPIEVSSSETIKLFAADADLALAEIDGNPGLEIVAVSLSRAITWINGAEVESSLDFAIGSELQIAALRVNADASLDLAVTIPSAGTLYQLVGDGAGGFAIQQQRDFGSSSPWDVTRLRTGFGVDGMIVAVREGDASHQHQELFFDVATSMQADQVLENYSKRWPVDLDGDEVDELVIQRELVTSIWKLDGAAYVELAQLPTTIDLPARYSETESMTCESFAAGDLDGDLAVDLVCMISGYASSSDYGVLVPFYQTGELVFERGEASVVASGGSNLRSFDLEGDGTPELLLEEAIVDIGAGGTIDCASPHSLGFGEVGNVDADPADEVVSWAPSAMPSIHKLSW